ncbi:MAG: peptide deformylase [Alphaproteobacteria bacterium]|jgi:peptide deformylase|nr:peptide deformylase [Alphaproteobacteria bacterium]
MAILEILTAPDPRLEEVCKPVEAVDASIRQLMDDMLETMYDAPGIGLAAIQVGVHKRVIVVDVAKDGEEPNPIRMANPEIIDEDEELSVYQEGCLSVPDIFEDVTRPKRCVVRYLDEHNQPNELAMDGLLATCVQHEIDHLNGILFIDHLSRLKKTMAIKKLVKRRKLKAAS